LCIIKQIGTEQDVKKAFEVLVAVRREMKPLFELPDVKTESEKEDQMKKLLEYKEILKAKRISRSRKPRRHTNNSVALSLASHERSGTRLSMRCTPRIRGSA
jgi:hypothetical protein